MQSAQVPCNRAQLWAKPQFHNEETAPGAKHSFTPDVHRLRSAAHYWVLDQ